MFLMHVSVDDLESNFQLTFRLHRPELRTIHRDFLYAENFSHWLEMQESSVSN